MIRQNVDFSIKDLKSVVIGLTDIMNTIRQVREAYFVDGSYNNVIEVEIRKMIIELQEHIGSVTVWGNRKK